MFYWLFHCSYRSTSSTNNCKKLSSEMSYLMFFQLWCLGHLQFPLTLLGMGGRSWCCCGKFEWTNSETVMDSDDLLLSSYTSRWAFYTKMQTRLLAVCDSQAYFGCYHLHTLRERKIQGWKLQCQPILSVHNYHIYNLILDGIICPRIVLCGMQGSTSAI